MLLIENTLFGFFGINLRLDKQNEIFILAKKIGESLIELHFQLNPSNVCSRGVIRLCANL
ncbi:hypothetical protein BpHYR1_049627 [Brachionus plicatilis]|uniref:Uncharacterized protein n=1 Tax=Brachionus plicatilis TaxID=10195 RepID=A0A3M7T2D9_BRAPC|nr:hypothetical protein BpHYR1_049627 [Brachionus plicatilis]